MPKGYCVGCRTDRYGGNVVNWIAALLLAKHNKLPIIHICDVCELEDMSCFTHRQGCCTDGLQINIASTIFHKILVNHCQEYYLTKSLKDLSDFRILPIEDFFAFQHECCENFKSSIAIQMKKTGFDAELFDELDSHMKEAGWQLRWKNPKKILVIHVRLEDVVNAQFLQSYIGDAKLIRLIKHAHHMFPKHEIHIVTSPLSRDISRCKRLTRFYPYVKGIWGDFSEDYALWQMMSSDILILSNSTFAAIAGLLHRGTQCFVYEYCKLFSYINNYGSEKCWEKIPNFK